MFSRTWPGAVPHVEMAQPQQNTAASPSLRESSSFHCTYQGAGAMTELPSFPATDALAQHFHHAGASLKSVMKRMHTCILNSSAVPTENSSSPSLLRLQPHSV